MKGFALAIALVLTLPLAAFAHSTCRGCEPQLNSDGALIASVPGLSRPGVPYIGSLNNSGGTLTGSNGAFTLTGSNLTEIRGITGADLGTVTFTTAGGPYDGGSLVITLNPGVLGGKLSGGAVLFNGSFYPGSVTWSPAPNDPGAYILQGAADGTLPNGTSGQAFVYEMYYGSINSNGVFTGTVGYGQIVVNPEPGTLGLFLTGLAGMAAAIRRKPGI